MTTRSFLRLPCALRMTMRSAGCLWWSSRNSICAGVKVSTSNPGVIPVDAMSDTIARSR